MDYVGSLTVLHRSCTLIPVTTTQTIEVPNELINWAKSHRQIRIVDRMVASDQFNLLVLQRLRNAYREPAVKSSVVAGPSTVEVVGSVVSAAEQGVEVESIAPSIPAPPRFLVWPGTYTVQTPERHYTFDVKVQPDDSDFAPGASVLYFMYGKDNQSDFKGMAFLDPKRGMTLWKKFRGNDKSDLVAAARILVADPNAEGVMLSKRCCVCGDKLTNPVSIAQGYGPVCARNMG